MSDKPPFKFTSSHLFFRKIIYDSETGISRDETDREMAARLGVALDQFHRDQDLRDAVREALEETAKKTAQDDQ